MADVYSNSLDAYEDLARMVRNVERGMHANSFSMGDSVKDPRILFALVFFLVITVIFLVQPKIFMDEQTKDLKGMLLLVAATACACLALLLRFFILRRLVQ